MASFENIGAFSAGQHGVDQRRYEVRGEIRFRRRVLDRTVRVLGVHGGVQTVLCQYQEIDLRSHGDRRRILGARLYDQQLPGRNGASARALFLEFGVLDQVRGANDPDEPAAEGHAGKFTRRVVELDEAHARELGHNAARHPDDALAAGRCEHRIVDEGAFLIE
uniref:hypothetical protein n=1 Tax=Roseivivax sediminis TaxID=936889 RepID=UPI00122C5548